MAVSGAALGGLSLASRGLPGSVGEHREGRLLARFDCTEEYPPERFFTNGPTGVVASQAGRYREAEGKPRARFASTAPLAAAAGASAYFSALP